MGVKLASKRMEHLKLEKIDKLPHFIWEIMMNYMNYCEKMDLRRVNKTLERIVSERESQLYLSIESENKIFSIDFIPNQTVFQLKEQIAKKINIHTDQIILKISSMGKFLDDIFLLSDYNIQNNSKLQLIMRLSKAK